MKRAWLKVNLAMAAKSFAQGTPRLNFANHTKVYKYGRHRKVLFVLLILILEPVEQKFYRSSPHLAVGKESWLRVIFATTSKKYRIYRKVRTVRLG